MQVAIVSLIKQVFRVGAADPQVLTQNTCYTFCINLNRPILCKNMRVSLSYYVEIALTCTLVKQGGASSSISENTTMH